MTSLPVSQSIEAEKRITGVEATDGDGFAGRFSGLAPGHAIVKNNAIAIVSVNRADKTPNGEQTLL